MSEREIREIIGWKLILERPDWPPLWERPDGKRFGVPPPVTVDDLLAWLRARGAVGSGAIDLIEPADPEGWTVAIWIVNGPLQDTEHFTAPTLLAALEAAVRAVAGEDEQ